MSCNYCHASEGHAYGCPGGETGPRRKRLHAAYMLGYRYGLSDEDESMHFYPWDRRARPWYLPDNDVNAAFHLGRVEGGKEGARKKERNS